MNSQRGWRSWWCWQGVQQEGKKHQREAQHLASSAQGLDTDPVGFRSSSVGARARCRVAVALLVGGGAEFSPLSITSLLVLQHSRSQHHLWVLLWFLVLAWPLSFI